MARGVNFFQTGIFILFGVFLLVGFSAFGIFSALDRGSSGGQAVLDIDLVVWGTLPSEFVNPFFTKIVKQSGVNSRIAIEYVEKVKEDFEDEYIRALALGQGPDITLLSHDQIFHLSDTFGEIPYENNPRTGVYFAYPRGVYEERFLPATEVFQGTQGISAIPFAIDPLVLFYNKNGLIRHTDSVEPIRTWDQLNEFTSAIQKNNSAIEHALLPFGAYGNYFEAASVLEALILQSSPETFLSQTNVASPEVSQSLGFYTDFSNTRHQNYTWNELLPSAFSMFASERLLFYPGFASSYETIKRINPNLALGVSDFPQLSKETQDALNTTPATSAKIYGFAFTRALLQSAVKTSQALVVMNTVTEDIENSQQEILRDYFANGVQVLPFALKKTVIPPEVGSYWTFFTRGALIGKAWRVYNPIETEESMINAIRSIVRGGEGLKGTSQELIEELRLVNKR